MFYILSIKLAENYHFFNLLSYITFRIALGAITALAVSLFLGARMIPWLYSLKFREKINEDVPERHRQKAGTPTMGGIIVVISVIISVLLWTDIRNLYVLLTLGATLWMALIGFYDDYTKMRDPNAKGIMARHKFLWQSLLGLLIGFALYFFSPAEVLKTYTEVPFFKNVLINLGLFYIPFVTFVVSGSSNAINLADGLDGLAIGLISICAAAFTVIAYITGRFDFSEYLHIQYLPGSAELSIFCAAIAGAGLGFLWFNAHPAQVFMGDTGSLAMGTALGVVSILVKKEFLLLVVGGVFVMETLSVILQVGSYRLRKKRIFKMAPIHHHFELLGWAEEKIVVRFWILGLIFALLGLSLLKIR